MADKFRKVIPIKITFADGEAPTSAKLNSIASQTRTGTAILEKAIGDIWNQSGDGFLTDNANISPLQIPNLARIIGPNSNLNPVWIPTTSSFVYKDPVGARFTYRNSGYLRFRPNDGSTVGSITVTGDTAGNFSGALQTREWEVDAAGKYWIDPATGKFRVYGPLDPGCKIQYIVNPAATWTLGQETLPAVIPDPGQTEFTGCRVEFSGGKYYLHLPPRRPLTLAERERPENYPTDPTEISDNTDTVGGGTKKYWSGATTALTGTGDEHYRYALPKEIQDMGLIEGNVIPGGLIYLWDNSTKTIVEDVVFKWPDASREGYALEVSSLTFDFANPAEVDSGEVVSSYDGTNLSLITCGTPLTRAIWTLASSFYKHSHRGEGTLESTIQHRDLAGLNPPNSYVDDEGHSDNYPTDPPSWPASRWLNDDHTSLLSRVGSQGVGSGREREATDNAMLGHLLLANQDPNNYIDSTLPSDSYRIYFGSVDTGPNIYGSGTMETTVSGQLFLNGYVSSYLHLNNNSVHLRSPDIVSCYINGDANGYRPVVTSYGEYDSGESGYANLDPGIHYFKVVPVNGFDQEMPGTEFSVSITDTWYQFAFDFTTVPGASYYRIYHSLDESPNPPDYFSYWQYSPSGPWPAFLTEALTQGWPSQTETILIGNPSSNTTTEFQLLTTTVSGTKIFSDAAIYGDLVVVNDFLVSVGSVSVNNVNAIHTFDGRTTMTSPDYAPSSPPTLILSKETNTNGSYPSTLRLTPNTGVRSTQFISSGTPGDLFINKGKRLIIKTDMPVSGVDYGWERVVTRSHTTWNLTPSASWSAASNERLVHAIKLPPNTFVPGSIVHVIGNGVWSPTSVNNPTIYIRLQRSTDASYLSGQLLAQRTLNAPSVTADQLNWDFRVQMTQPLGTPTWVDMCGMMFQGDGALTVSPIMLNGSTTPNFTSANADGDTWLTISMSWSASTTTTFSVSNCIVELS